MFQAKYDGRCPVCENPINKGDNVSMVDSDRGRITIHEEHMQDGEIHVETGTKGDHTTGVMPRGRSATDRCGRCFQVPANNGACGCDA